MSEQDVWDIPIGQPRYRPFTQTQSSLMFGVKRLDDRACGCIDTGFVPDPIFVGGIRIKPIDGIMTTVGKLKHWKRRGVGRRDKIKDTRREVPGCYLLVKENVLVINTKLWDEIKDNHT